MTRAEIATFLQRVYIFSKLSVGELALIADRFRVVSFEPGTVIFNEGDPGSEMFIVREGRVATLINLPGGQKKEIAEFTPGDFFGEMTVFENVPRSATCIATEASTLLSLGQQELLSLIDPFPEIVTSITYRMLSITTQRLRDTGEFLSELVRWGEGASRRAVTDEVTGVYNRRFLDEVIVDHFETSKTTGRPLSIIMVDLDYFRDINEQYGVETGDRTFQEVVGVIKDHLSDPDILARYGGDEFTVLLPGSRLEDACRIAERIRVGVERLDFLKDMPGTKKGITISQGVASYPENARDLKTLREKADAALYAAKEGGRNRVARA